MSSFLDLFGGDVVSSVATLFNGILDRVAPDQTVKLQIQEKLAELEANGELAKLTAATTLANSQIAVDALEAKNINWFVAGWRPFIGWICGIILLNNYVLVPYVDFVAGLVHSQITVPVLDWHGVAPILITMLGGGSMILRSFEKHQNIQGRHS